MGLSRSHSEKTECIRSCTILDVYVLNVSVLSLKADSSKSVLHKRRRIIGV